ncbi:hypothetical protein D082_25370 [Synechocystis sp. PCC 6714]|nr:hypothetical protein D082_25370 [Synechocystis sp. PCC 6714]
MPLMKNLEKLTDEEDNLFHCIQVRLQNWDYLLNNFSTQANPIGSVLMDQIKVNP